MEIKKKQGRLIENNRDGLDIIILSFNQIYKHNNQVAFEVPVCKLLQLFHSGQHMHRFFEFRQILNETACTIVHLSVFVNSEMPGIQKYLNQ